MFTPEFENPRKPTVHYATTLAMGGERCNNMFLNYREMVPDALGH